MAVIGGVESTVRNRDVDDRKKYIHSYAVYMRDSHYAVDRVYIECRLYLTIFIQPQALVY